MFKIWINHILSIEIDIVGMLIILAGIIVVMIVRALLSTWKEDAE